MATRSDCAIPGFIKNSILYMDDSIIIINKPARIAVHGGRAGGENLEQYLHELQFGYQEVPILLHRLDKETSGCLILGRNKQALGRIGKMFMAKRIHKVYWAVIFGKNFDKTEGRIDFPLRKQSPVKHLWWMEAHPEGKPSITDYKVLGESGDFTFLELYPRTGRTHQLRVHCQAIGYPIVGDKIYGDKSSDKIMHLHARLIKIPRHDQQPIEVTAPPPPHMLDLLQKCGYKYIHEEYKN